MESLTKVVTRQDANFKLSPSTSNETSINLSSEISSLISSESGDVSFKIYKTDFIRALSALCLLPKIYHKKETESTSTADIFATLSAQIVAEFGDAETSQYTIKHLKRDDGRAYFNNLKQLNGFNLRSFLVEQFSVIEFIKTDNNSMELRLNTLLPEESYTKEISEVHEDEIEPANLPLQVIYFGAPGTGKSHKINKASAKYPTFRTTFHPDTDYSSFVGSYKPITIKVPIYGIQGQPIRDDKGEKIMEDRIVYHYVFQAFLQAYIKAWEEQTKEEPRPVFLVIEEINRGNCAQIFGDIFQLLDRNGSGFSDYPIVADKDLAQELNGVLKNLEIVNADKINAMYEGRHDVVSMVKRGERLLLPNNLYIWATMNTSDQSLFPIDSAFKRRWDWEYIKIKDHSEQSYGIQFSNGNRYDWWQFVTAINEQIEGGEIQQEDKKLGYFFAKTADGTITAKRFLSKVIFYLYTDVFKDFGFDEPFFKDETGETMTFASYFNEEGDPDENRVERFLTNLGLEPIETKVSDETPQELGTDESFFTKNESIRSVSIDFEGQHYDKIGDVAKKIFKRLGENLTLAEISQTIAPYQFKRNGFDMIVNSIPEGGRSRFWTEPFTDTNEHPFYVSNHWVPTDCERIKNIVKAFPDIFISGISI